MKNFKTILGISIAMLVFVPFVGYGAAPMPKNIPEPNKIIPNPEITQTGQKAGQQKHIEKQKNVETGQEAVETGLNQDVEQKGKGINQAGSKATQRRSRVASSVQEMLWVAERNQGIGQQIRTIAQAQNQNQEQVEAQMEQVKNRGQLKKFFFGPDYKNLNSIEEKLKNHEEKLSQLRDLAEQIVDKADATKLQEQIDVMEQVKIELEKEVIEESKGFSLFGWLNKMLVK